MNRKWMSKTDVLVCAVLLIAGVLSIVLPKAFSKDTACIAELTIDGQVVLTLSLQDIEERKTYAFDNGVTIAAENHSVAFLSSDCADEICVKTGALTKIGDVAACVPNATVLCVKGESRADVDGLTY